MSTRVAAAWMVLCSIAFFPIELPTGAGKLMASSLEVAMAQEPAQVETPAQDVPEETAPAVPEQQRPAGRTPFDFMRQRPAARPRQVQPQTPAAQTPAVETQPSGAQDLAAPVAPPTPQYAPMVPVPQTTAPAIPPITPSAALPVPQAPAAITTAPEIKPPAVQPQPVPAKPFVAPPPQTPRPAARRGDVSFNFDDADIYSVIQTVFGDILRANYIIDPAVKGRVTFRSVEPVTKESVLPLLEVILRLNGVGIVEEGGLYRIIPISDITREPATVGIGRESGKVAVTGKALVQVVSVKYVPSSEMVRILTPFLSKTAVIIDVPKSNYIVVVDTDANVKRLLQIVEIFDSEALKQVTPQVFVYPIQNSKAKDVASLLQQIFQGAKATPKTPAPTARPPVAGQTQPAASPPVTQPAAAGQHGVEALVAETTRIIADEITNSIIILASPEDYTLIRDTIQKIDIVPRQVVIEGLIVRVDLIDNLSFGFGWSMDADVKITGLTPFRNDMIDLDGSFSINSGVINPEKEPTTGFTFVGRDSKNNVRAKITAALKDSKARILAAPHVLVSDNREARIQVGSQIPIATSQTSTPIGSTTVTNTTTSTIQYKDIGIILKVKPQVNDGGLVAMEIAQEVSSVGDSVDVAGSKNVTINKTEATTNLVAQDGETIIIGGLIREDSSKGKEGLPLLSKIPVLGALFSTTTNDNTRTELIILLTPHVVKNQGEAKDVTTDYLSRYKGATKDEKIDEFITERGARKQGNGKQAPADPKQGPRD